MKRRRWPAAARLVGAGTMSPRVEIRDRRGRWIVETLCDDKGGRRAVRRFEDLAAWARAQGERAGRRNAKPHRKTA